MVLLGDVAIMYCKSKKNAKNFLDYQRGNSKPPRTNPRTRTGLLPVEQYELLLDGQRLLIITLVNTIFLAWSISTDFG